MRYANFQKFFCRTPCRGRFLAASRRGNWLCANDLRRRFGTPKNLFSRELTQWPKMAPVKTAAPAKPPLFQGVKLTIVPQLVTMETCEILPER